MPGLPRRGKPVDADSQGGVTTERLRRHVEMPEEVDGELAEMNEWLSGFHGFEQGA